MAGLLFEDIFEVLVVDPDGKRFDKGALHPPLLPPFANVAGGFNSTFCFHKQRRQMCLADSIDKCYRISTWTYAYRGQEISIRRFRITREAWFWQLHALLTLNCCWCGRTRPTPIQILIVKQKYSILYACLQNKGADLYSMSRTCSIKIQMQTSWFWRSGAYGFFPCIVICAQTMKRLRSDLGMHIIYMPWTCSVKVQVQGRFVWDGPHSGCQQRSVPLRGWLSLNNACSPDFVGRIEGGMGICGLLIQSQELLQIAWWAGLYSPKFWMAV